MSSMMGFQNHLPSFLYTWNSISVRPYKSIRINVNASKISLSINFSGNFLGNFFTEKEGFLLLDSVKIFAVTGDYFLVPVERILAVTFKCTVAHVVLINIDEAVAFGHLIR